MTDQLAYPALHAPADFGIDEYWALLRSSLRTALGRPADPGARPAAPPAPADTSAPLQLRLATPEPAASRATRLAERYGWGM